MNNPMNMNEKGNGIANFIKYHNAVPIILGVLFFGTTATFAATPAAREAIFAEESGIISTDTSYLLAANLEEFPFSMRITSVTEDDETFYLSYDFDTIMVVSGVWQAVTIGKELRVSKALLGENDLEAYAESELAQVRAAEVRLLRETQAFEQRLGVSEKIVATVYTGLIGDLLDPTEEHVPQYISEVAKNDPLYLKTPVTLLSWDENAETITPHIPEPGVPGPDGEEPFDICPDWPGMQINVESCIPPQEDDVCPDIEGIQFDDSECPVVDDPSGGGEEEPPIEEPPAEEPPAEEPPAEEPPVEEPPAEDPPPSP